MLLGRVEAEQASDNFFLISAVAARVYTYCGKLAFFTPTFYSERRNAKYVGDFADCQQIG